MAKNRSIILKAIKRIKIITRFKKSHRKNCLKTF